MDHSTFVVLFICFFLVVASSSSPEGTRKRIMWMILSAEQWNLQRRWTVTRQSHARCRVCAWAAAARERPPSKGGGVIEWRDGRTKVRQKERQGARTSCGVFKGKEQFLCSAQTLQQNTRKNELILVRACERFAGFDPALVCVAAVPRCEIPHARYPVDPGTRVRPHSFLSCSPNMSPGISMGGRGLRSFGMHNGTHFVRRVREAEPLRPAPPPPPLHLDSNARVCTTGLCALVRSGTADLASATPASWLMFSDFRG